ncbi:MAG: FadR/GntR family transcriptional regulator [Pseudomonadota bacterium]|jgi:DNA-binding FadR family transcriptional regulator
MTGQRASRLPRKTKDAPAAPRGLLRPLNPARRRTEEVVERIADQIGSGKLVAGTKLPTEQEMMIAMGVSRTVVREAISALRARGLVVTRQGAGAFVSSDPAQQPYAINPDGLGSLSGVIELLELRTAVEMESAAIASERATAAELKAIRQAAATFSKAARRDDRAVQEDFDFHRAIALATHNRRFTGFLEYLGGLIIPRQSIRLDDDRSYLQKVASEHDMILAAIELRAPDKARAAMRQHLVNGRERYRRLAAPIPANGKPVRS